MQSRISRQLGWPIALDQSHGVGGSVQKVAFGRRQRLQAQRHAGLFQHAEALADNFGGVVERLCRRHARQHVALQRRAEDHPRSAQIAAQPGQFLHVLGGAAADFGFGTGEIVARRFGQQPVQADDFKPGGARLSADLGALRGARSRGRRGPS